MPGSKDFLQIHRGKHERTGAGQVGRKAEMKGWVAVSTARTSSDAVTVRLATLIPVSLNVQNFRNDLNPVCFYRTETIAHQ
jgi:hypothetical protein